MKNIDLKICWKGGNKMITFSSLSSFGNREYNEDSIQYVEESDNYFFVLADGLGSHGLGDIASKTACNIFCDNYIELGLEKTCQLAQQKILEKQDQEKKENSMKTTVAAININTKSKTYEQIHLGDSRIYHFNRLRLLSQTKDHSVCQKLANAHLIKESEIRHHRDRNKLLDVLGSQWSIQNPFIIKKGTFKRFEAILICSDGFWEYIDEKEMIRCLRKSTTPEEWLSNMEKIVIKNGSNHNMDNYSAFTIYYRG